MRIQRTGILALAVLVALSAPSGSMPRELFGQVPTPAHVIIVIEENGGYIQWAKTHNSLFILTFDEGSRTGNSQIATLFVGGMIRGGKYDATINHYSVLRTVEDMFGLPHAGESATAKPVVDCWIATPAALKAPPLVPELLRVVVTGEFQ